MSSVGTVFRILFHLVRNEDSPAAINDGTGLAHSDLNWNAQQVNPDPAIAE